MDDKNLNNPLDELFTDSGSQTDPEELAMILKPFLRIHRDSGRVLFTTEGMKISANNRIILFILARKAMYMQKIKELDSIAPKEIKEELGQNIPFGTIDASLKRLLEKGLINSRNGKYFVSDFNFPQILEIFAGIIQKIEKQKEHILTNYKPGGA